MYNLIKFFICFFDSCFLSISHINKNYVLKLNNHWIYEGSICFQHVYYRNYKGRGYSEKVEYFIRNKAYFEIYILVNSKIIYRKDV